MPARTDAPTGGARPGLIGLDSSPLHGELLGVERLEERARALAAGFTLARNPRRGRPHLLRRLTDKGKSWSDLCLAMNAYAGKR